MNNHNRTNSTRRMRLKGYDYHNPGYYFLTCCQRNRESLFIDETASNWVLTQSGMMIQSAILEIESRFMDIQMDSLVIMPNHIHLLLGLATTIEAIDPSETDSIVDAMHWLKTVTTGRYIQGVKKSGWPRFNGQLWQEGYHDRIVRNERELELIRRYIHENPMRWREDEFYEN